MNYFNLMIALPWSGMIMFNLYTSKLVNIFMETSPRLAMSFKIKDLAHTTL